MDDRASKLLERAKKLDDQAFYELMAEAIECAELFKEMDPIPRRMWPAHLIQELYDEQNGLCARCGEPLSLDEKHVDHMIPHTYGGGNERFNLGLTHPGCNLSKGAAIDPHQLLRYLEGRALNLPRIPR